MSREPSDVALLAARIARACPVLPSAFTVARMATDICRLEKSLRRAAERYCNGEIDEQGFDRARARIVNDVVDAGAAIPLNAGMDIRTESDPRGPVLLLRLPGEGTYATV